MIKKDVGQWKYETIPHYEFLFCPNCDFIRVFPEASLQIYDYYFCPKCGAKNKEPKTNLVNPDKGTDRL